MWLTLEIENLPDDLQDLFMMATYKDTHFEASRKLLQKKRSFLLKKLDRPEEEVNMLRKKLDKENKRALGYIDEKISHTEKLYNAIG